MIKMDIRDIIVLLVYYIAVFLFYSSAVEQG